MEQESPLGSDTPATPASQRRFSPESRREPTQQFGLFKHKKLFDVSSVCGRCGRHLLYEEFIPLIQIDWSVKDVEYIWETDVLILPLRLVDRYVTVNVDSRDSRIVGEWTNLCGTTEYHRSALSPFSRVKDGNPPS